MKIGRLFVGVKPTNEKNHVVVASWSYVTGYWRWAIWRSPWKSWRFRFYGAYGTELRFRPTPRSQMFAANLCIPLLGAFHFSTQPPSPAMKNWGKS